MKDKDGGPAFPTTKPLEFWGDPNRGMSLRDWFAGMAMQMYLHVNAHTHGEAAHQGSMKWARQFAQDAYAMADAMIEAREL
jgi:hypothetical protein